MNRFTAKRLVVLPLVALVQLGGGALVAAETVQLNTSVYVFKQSEFRSIKAPAATVTNGSEPIIVRSPATLVFERDELSLAGAGFSWSGGRNPPERFTLLKIPEVSTGPGKRVEIVSTAPIQYLEKQPDGSLQVRNIAAESADAPHCRITFTVLPADAASGDFGVSCQLDIATVRTRESVTGVSLDVGRPVLARFQHQVEFGVHSSEWAGVVLRDPAERDQSLLVLVKVAPGQRPGATAQTSGPMTAEEFATFATYYYLHPEPEQIARAIESLQPAKFLDEGSLSAGFFHQSGFFCVGFFAEVFAANPDRVPEWQKLIERQGGNTRFWLGKALKLQSPGAMLKFGALTPANYSELDAVYVVRGAFFASGNTAYIGNLIDRLEWVDEASTELFDAGAQAMVLLAYNAPHHPLVPQTLKAAREKAGSRKRELIDDLLNKNLTAVLEELRDLDLSSASDSISNARNLLPWRRAFPQPYRFSRGSK